MPRNVPDQHVPGLAAFLALSDDDVEKLNAALRSTSLNLDPNKALAGSVAQIASLQAGDAEKITSALFSLYMGVAGSGETTASFVEDIIVALEEKKSDDLEPLGKNREKFKDRFVAFLSVEPIATSIRALSIQFEHRFTFSRVRVATDIRPVFGESAEEPPKAAIIAHSLNLHYYEGSQHKEFHVALDTKDIQAMIDILKRAQLKAKQLESVIKKTEFPFLG